MTAWRDAEGRGAPIERQLPFDVAWFDQRAMRGGGPRPWDRRHRWPRPQSARERFVWTLAAAPAPVPAGPPCVRPRRICDHDACQRRPLPAAPDAEWARRRRRRPGSARAPRRLPVTEFDDPLPAWD